jgi:integrase
MKDWYKAVCALRNATMRDYLLLVAFTGLRKNEAAKLLWENVDFQAKTIMVKDTKNHEDHMLPMTGFLHRLLLQRWDGRENEYVFSSSGDAGHLVDGRDDIAKVVSQSNVKFTLHDLRRTFETVAESLDIPHYALKHLLNHKMGTDVTAGYIVVTVERLRNPMQKITDYLCEQMGIEKIVLDDVVEAAQPETVKAAATNRKSKVVPLKKAKA